MYNGSEKIEAFIPDDNCIQSSAFKLLKDNYKESKIDVLDLGCGKGNSMEIFRKLNQKMSWNGIDVNVSPELDKDKVNGKFQLYDGINIPFEDNYFDLIFCRQVLEHVNKPYELINEVSRVLKNSGVFIGSTSNLEAFHALSTFNYTPYGFTLLFKEIPLKIIEIRPGIDFLTLWASRLSNRSRLLNNFFARYFERQSPLNSFIEITMKGIKKSNKDINLMKLLFSGHFCFVAEKSE